jgi:hypothetical protein
VTAAGCTALGLVETRSSRRGDLVLLLARCSGAFEDGRLARAGEHREEACASIDRVMCRYQAVQARTWQ